MFNDTSAHCVSNSAFSRLGGDTDTGYILKFTDRNNGMCFFDVTALSLIYHKDYRQCVIVCQLLLLLLLLLMQNNQFVFVFVSL